MTFISKEVKAAPAGAGGGWRRDWGRALALLGALLAAVPPLRALDPAKSVFQFNCQNWTRASGLPADKINAIAQTRDGYIWLGSQNGLIRFDGQEFKVVPIKLPEAQGQDIDQLSLAPDNRLWFSIANGGYGNFDGRNFHAIGDPRWNVQGMDAHAILATADGAVWTGSAAGWGRWVEGKPGETLFRDPADSVYGLWTVASGRIWLGTADKGLFYWNGTEFKSLADPALEKSVIESVVEDRAGDLWVATTRGLYCYDTALRPKENFWPGTATKALLVDSHGVLWAGTFEDGLGRYQDGKFTMLRKADGLASDAIRTLFEDREGSLWVGTADGLSQLTDLKFPLLTEKEGFAPGPVYAVAAGRHGGLWSVTTQGVSWFDGHTVRNYLSPSLFAQRAVRRVFVASNGDAYLVDGDRNIGILRGEPPLKTIPNQSWPEAFAEDATSVLAGVGPTLMRLQDDRIEPYHFDGAVPPFDWIVNLFVARDNAIWASTNNGLFRVKDGKFRRWTTADGIASNRTSYVTEDPDGSIWVGSPAGLTRIKGEQVTRIGADDGLPDPRVFAIVADESGYLWLDSGRGLTRVTRQSLTDFADGKARRITCESFNDLESVKFIDRTDQAFSAAKTADGRLWFPNSHGIIMVDPVNFFTNRVPPVVTIERVEAGRREVSGAHPITLESGDGNLEFFFSALSFIAPRKMKVRYQLEGADATWIEAGTKRSAAYANLAAGRYVFRVEAANADGVWNRTADGVAFELPPPFYQRPWFYPLIGLAAAAGLYGIYRWNVWQLRNHQRKLQADNDRLEAMAAERTKELAQSLSLLTATLESTADAIMVADLTGRVISCNAKFNAMWQLADHAAESGKGVRLYSIIAEKVRGPEQYLARVHELYAQPEAESRDVLELKDGRIIERDSQPQRLDGRCIGRVWCFRDITERERAKTALLNSQHFLEATLNALSDHIAILDDCGEILEVNAAWRRCADRDRSTGRPQGVGDNYLAACDAADGSSAAAAAAGIRAVIAGGRDEFQMEYPAHGEAGQRWLAVRITRFAGDGPVRVVVAHENITARKQAEAALAETSALLEALLQHATDAIYFKDRASRFVRVSRRIPEIFGLEKPADFVGRTDFDLFTSAHAQPAFDAEQEIIRTGRPLLNVEEMETYRDGRITWALTSKMPWYDQAGAIVGTMGISRDITDRKRIEAQMLQAQKLETVGKLAGGIAHEFNNILTAIIGQSELLLGEVPAGSRPAASAREIAQAAARAAALTRQLLAYGRKQVLKPEVLEVNRVVAGMRNVIRHLAGENVTLEIVAAPHLRAVLADIGQIEQVIVNLVINAREAMLQGGKLTLETAPVSVAAAGLDRWPEFKPGDYVLLAITDTGVGMSPEVKARVFEPFFTTKGVGEGSGLGLSTCYGIVKQSGGYLSVDSEPGRGTTFRVYLPQVDPTTIVPAERLDAPGLPRGKENILLVEEDSALREMAAALLSRLGYQVEVATDAASALDLNRAGPGAAIDLIFTDCASPSLAGAALAERFRASFPRARLLVTSTYPENLSAGPRTAGTGVASLQKPFTPSALARKVREVLDAIA